MNIVQNQDVSIRDDLLVITLHDSVNPVIWQMDRDRFRTAAFDVLQRQSAFFIRFKPREGAPTDIAEYTDRARALVVLKSIQHVLMDGPNTGAQKYFEIIGTKPRTQQIILAGACVILFVVLSVILFTLIPPPTNQESIHGMDIAPSVEPGIPQSADDVFKSQESR